MKSSSRVILTVSIIFILMLTLIRRAPVQETISAGQNVIISGGWQIVEMRAKGGYSPRVSSAVAGIPTILRFRTSGTFDCSLALRIPSQSISKNLPPSGVTDIPIGIPQSGSLKGSCSMGMYPFRVDFKAP